MRVIEPPGGPLVRLTAQRTIDRVEGYVRAAIPLRLILVVTFVIAAAGSTPGAAVGIHPGSMASTGDSITRAFNTASFPFIDNPASSWSTGTDPLVSSHYSRLIALDPGISGRSYNHSASGARMSDLHGQMVGVNARGVDYVTVLMGANDVCTPTEVAMTAVADFRAQFVNAMQAITTGSPAARVYVISIPDAFNLWMILKNNASARGAWVLFGICQSMLADPLSTAVADSDRRARVRQRNQDFNTQLASVCAAYTQCRFDGNAVFNTAFTTADVSTRDYFHPSLAGQAKIASVSWSVGYWGASSPSIGGRGLRLTTQGSLTWTSGTLQTGYVIARLSDLGTTILPPEGPLPAFATAFSDAFSSTGFLCYVVFAVGPTGALGNSDLLCRLEGVATGAGPANFTVRLNESNTASLSWTPPGPQDAYLLVTFGAEQLALGATATGASVSVSAPSCFVLYALSGATVLGITDVLCAYPGYSSFGAAPAPLTDRVPTIQGARDSYSRPVPERPRR